MGPKDKIEPQVQYALHIQGLSTCTNLQNTWEENGQNWQLYSVHGQSFFLSIQKLIHQALLVQKLDSAIHQINHYPMD